MKTIIRYSEEICENFDENKRMGRESFEIDSTVTLKELMFELLSSLDEEAIKDDYKGSYYECWFDKLGEDEVYISETGKEGFDINDFLNDDVDFDITLSNIESIVKE